MDEKEFNLIYEQWIPVMRQDGQVTEVGLKDVLVKSHEYLRLASELPSLDLALMRLCMGLVYAIHRDTLTSVEDMGDAIGAWKAIKDEGRFNESMIGEYFGRYEDRFFLFHPTRPFYQAPITKGTPYGAAKLIGTLSESNNKPRLFPIVSGDSKKGVGYPEAARWLVYVNAYDDNSSKPTMRKSGLPRTGAGWVGKIGPVYFTGRNLFETLLLNMPFINMFTREPFEDGSATWEPDAVKMAERTEIPLPSSPIELLTLQSRRILLKREKSIVTGFILIGGDFFQQENAFTEHMTAWRRNATGNWVPMRHDPARFVWRDFNSLLLENEMNNSPGVVKWVSQLVMRGVIPEGSVRIATAGVKYGDNDFLVTGVVHDGLSINSQLLSDFGKNWRIRISEVLARTDDCVIQFGKLAENLAVAGGEDEDDNDALRKLSIMAREQAYHRFDAPFRTWLASIEPAVDSEDERIPEWEHIMRSILFSMADDMVDACGIKAIIGRDMQRNAFSNLRLFKNSVNKILRGD